jgi:hypothetical protein
MSILEDIGKEEAKLDMTPMIDVVFQLIIFFMCNIKYKTLEGRLDAYLPKDVGVNQTEAEPVEKIEITIKVQNEGERRDPLDMSLPWSGEGRFEYVGRKLNYQIGPRTTADVGEVQKILARSAPTSRARRSSTWSWCASPTASPTATTTPSARRSAPASSARRSTARARSRSSARASAA